MGTFAASFVGYISFVDNVSTFVTYFVECFGYFIKEYGVEYVGTKIQAPVMTITTTALGFVAHDTLGASTHGTKSFVVEIEPLVKGEGSIGTDTITRDE